VRLRHFSARSGQGIGKGPHGRRPFGGLKGARVQVLAAQHRIEGRHRCDGSVRTIWWRLAATTTCGEAANGSGGAPREKPEHYLCGFVRLIAAPLPPVHTGDLHLQPLLPNPRLIHSSSVLRDSCLFHQLQSPCQQPPFTSAITTQRNHLALSPFFYTAMLFMCSMLGLGYICSIALLVF
jgi:hypothetical protein